jgi:hypothetical protein
MRVELLKLVEWLTPPPKPPPALKLIPKGKVAPKGLV